ncbi:MAG: hypothetical protein IJT90_03755 [Bacteroidaceae bacterium]|nr:hypothetical protein [Bacteroidaceae bacterium]
MSNKTRVTIGYVVGVVLAIAITGMAVSVWAKPYTSAKDTTKAIVQAITDTTKTLVISGDANKVLAESNLVDTLAINTAFLQKMREKGELLSSDEFASRITDYYNTLVAVLTALFVLFTIVTYLTIKSQFESKFENKAKELEDKQRQLEDKQRQKIIDELRSMLSDSKSIDVVIQSAIGGRIEDNIAKKEEVDDLSTNVEANQKNIASVTATVNDIKKKQQEIFNVVAELQEQVATGATIHHVEEPVPVAQSEQAIETTEPEA